MKWFIVRLLLSNTAYSDTWGVEQWALRYLSPCNPKTPNHVCFDKTKRNFKRMLEYKDMMFKYLDRYNLPRWLATIPFIESEYTEKAISKKGAVGLWQIMSPNLIYYLTKKRGPINGYYIITKPTREKAIKIGSKPEKNTEIACRMLKHLYEKYGKENHETVVRAYNAGERRINNALKGLGRPLKDETINYYAQLMALQMLLDDITGDNIYKLR